jgi:UDP-N-acetylmuramoyl-tripeptide--D-alanyl-D-alanine ligase
MSPNPPGKSLHPGPQFCAAQVASSCDGHVALGHPGAIGQGVCTDTRKLEPGQVFFALKGANHDAHNYLDQAVEGGASVLVVERMPHKPIRLDGLAIVQVRDTTDALLDLARWHRSRLSARVLAVTGSYGKTTTKEMLRAILAPCFRVTAAPASYNNRIGVALTLLDASPHDEFVVLELGTNHPGEIDELAEAAAPDIAAITAIAEVHLEGLGSLEGVREAKAEIIRHLPPRGTLVLNADNEQCMMLTDRHPGPVVTFGTAPEADVHLQKVRPLGDGWSFEALGATFLLPVGGRYNTHNAAAALAMVREVGVDTAAALDALAAFNLPGLRYQRETIQGVRFVQDCYNSNPAAMRAAVQSFAAEKAEGKKVVVCGDMLELGEKSPALHRELGGHLAACRVDALVAVGAMGRHVLEGWNGTDEPTGPGLQFSDADTAWRRLWNMLEPGDAVLLKGSRGVHLESIIERIRANAGTEQRGVA